MGNNSFIRCDTFLSLKFSSIIFNNTHGPSIQVGEAQTRQPMLAFVLNPTDMKGGRSGNKTGGGQDHADASKTPKRKARGKQKRITGCWRNRNYLQCGVGMTGMSLFVYFYYGENHINFYDADRDKCPMWWNLKIWGKWKNTRVAGTAYSRLLKQCNISWGKIIHMRSAGIEYASAVSELDQAGVATMSKHQQSVMDKVYMTKLYGPLLRVMTGFKVDDNSLTH